MQAAFSAMPLRESNGAYLAIILNGMEWSERLKQRRLELGWTQQKAADAIGVTQAAYAHWESGRRTPDKLRMFDRIARGLECSAAWLLFGVHTPSDPRAAHIVHAMESLPDYKVEVLVRVVDGLSADNNAMPEKKASGQN